MAINVEVQDGVGEVIIDSPPVNALNNAGWQEFAQKMIDVGRRDDVHCVVIRSNGRGFQAGVDVKGTRGRQRSDRGVEPRLLRHFRCDLRLSSADDLGGARLLHRRRDRNRGLF